METVYFGIILFLFLLAIFDLVVGVTFYFSYSGF